MKKGLVVNLGILLLVTSMAFVTPTKAATDWGVEPDVLYKYELVTLKLGTVDYASYLADNFTMRINFDSFDDTGYTYTIYNATGGSSVNETLFVEIPIDEVTLTLPTGLPFVLPLSIGTKSDYLSYFGEFVNVSNTIYLLEDLLLNITEYANVTYTGAHSLLNENYLSLYFDLFAPEVDGTILSELMGEGVTGFPSLPVNITDFKLNTTVRFNSTSGLLYDIALKIDSVSNIDEYTEPFLVDVRYRLYVPPAPEPEPEPEPETEENSYAWFVPMVAAFTIVGVLVIRKRK